MKKKVITLVCILQLIFLTKGFSQNVSINTTGVAADASAMLDITSQNKGLLIPRMTQAERTAISTPADALLVYQSDGTKGFYYYSTLSNTWIMLATNGSAVTSASVVSANGLAGTVANASTTPAITISTTVNGIVKGNGTALTSAVPADFPTLNQNTTGTATNITGVLNATSFPALTGDVTNGVGSLATTISASAITNEKIASNAVTNTKLATMPMYTFKANNTAGASAPSDITGIQATALLDVFSTTAKGLVPLSPGGTTSFLRADGSFAVPSYSSTNAWALVGNSGTTSVSNFLGTTDYKSLKIRTNNIQRVLVDSLGNVGIGTTPTFSTTDSLREKLLVDAGLNPASHNVISARGNMNKYLQLNVMNASSGTAASSDIVASNNIASETVNYIDMGINSTGYASTATGGILAGPSNAYLYSTGNDFILGNASSGKDLIFFTDGTGVNDEKMRITSDGKVGIGGTDFDEDEPEKLFIDGGTSSSSNLIGAYADVNKYVQIGVQNINSGQNASSDIVATADNGTNTTNYIDMGINSSGYANNASNILNRPNVGYIYTNATSDFFIGNGAPDQGMAFFTNNGSAGNLTANGKEAMRIDGNGNIGIGGTSRNNSGIVTINLEKLVVDGNIVPRSSGNGNLGTSTYKWNTVNATNGVIQTSDRRLKTNIRNLRYGLKEVLALQPISYNWKDTSNKENKIGLIAQDVQKLVPEVVIGDETKEKLGMNYAELVPVLINAIKEQQKQIDDLKKQVEKLQK